LALERSGARDALVCPIGFVADHLEILYDLDVEAQAFAQSHGIKLRRTESFNDRPEFVAAMAEVVSDSLTETRNSHGPGPIPRQGEFPARRL
jgi:ferrochelatase